MASQGAGFAFDMSNMDFGTTFAIPQLHQQPASKPVEGDTSTSFFFGDEGIDTGSFCTDTFNPAMLSLSQEQTYLPQIMDNTLGNSLATTAWDDQLAPNTFDSLNTFMPLTPAQSFDSVYPHSQLGSALGKRSLQLDMHDFPVAKRHESLGEYTTISPLQSSTATTSSWTFDTQPTPASSMEMGLSDEAADVCTMWFNKYAVLPSDKHIESLSQLTGEPAPAIRSWFGRLIKQGMGDGHNSDSAYRSQTALNQRDQFWNEPLQADPLQQTQSGPHQQQHEVTTIPEVTHSHDTTTTSPPATTLRGGKKRCAPTNDVELLTRDPNKIYQCTRKCGKRYGRKCDWKRNEEEGYPCKSWVCSLCTSEGVQNVKPCFRKYHFSQHFRNIHPGLNADDHDESSVVCSETEFPRRCGFCRHKFSSRQERIDHIADHFKQGKCMLDWTDDHNEDNEDSDDSNDDDSRPGDDGFDGSKPSYHPPGNNSGGSPDSKYYGGSGGSGSNGDASGGGFFQFQLSQLEGGHTGDQCSIGEQLIKPVLPTQHHQRLVQSELPTHDCEQHSEPMPDPGEPGSCVPPSIPKKHVSSEGDATDSTDTLARDDVSGTLIEVPRRRSSPKTMHSPSGVTLNAISLATSSACGICPLLTPAQDMQLATTRHSPDVFKHSFKTLQNTTIPVDAHSFLSIRLLGAGGFSTVDEVVHRETNLRLSRKTLKNRDQSAIEELQKEVNVLKKLRHPHIIRLLGSYSMGDRMSILLSPVAETNLALWLAQPTVLKPAKLSGMVAKMGGCLVSSVRYLHEQRPAIRHGDIKPQNILVMQGDQGFPRVVLSDFGTSSSDELNIGQSKPLTRQYIAPEALNGTPRKEAADIWSLGCVFLEMMTWALDQRNAKWLGERAGKCYWQDVLGLQAGLEDLLLEAPTPKEQIAVRTVKAMLSAEPEERPSAASLSMTFTPASCCLNWANNEAIFPGPDEELLAAELAGHEHGIDCQHQVDLNGTGKPNHGVFINDGNLSEPNANVQDELEESPDVNKQLEGFPDDNHLFRKHAFDNAKHWLEACTHTHDTCRRPDTASNTDALPTRLVDIHPLGQDSPYIRAINSATLTPQTAYIALSHVWDPTDTISLSRDFLKTQHQDFPRAALPRTYNRAIHAAHRLGYRYIWDDRLCIMQDCEADRRVQCARMASVFRNAALTLVLDQLHTNDKDSSNDKHRSTTAHNPVIPDSVLAAPGFAWDTRAWALQDRLLSRRLLRLGTRQMYWECGALRASDVFPQGLAPLVWEKVHCLPVTRMTAKKDAACAAPHECAAPMDEHRDADRDEDREAASEARSARACV
ncbi:hypothetical protein P153DRAFT_367866 [Dothidotthia symphoricarpi CBS 119687]|uniref:Protein kinase domain-containing protein n=1 Tax=Dothidotthia symphoricarpi CBS 119687 TaxID=1392245 RepID=A0A6A6A9S2_9PLEO|nr:uncharacterized protein P153DRAFT_367866 [Dothidotthia symphoricarpi CBS 119687]KAF2127943.1 hypothetical protein P153DRAFT_367866 [Dothidotthia symphoricarpi CBS 119687]